MKAEEPTSSSTTPATTPATPATTYPTQWASTLQQQTSSQYYSYASHYGQTPYATHYQAYAPPVSAAAATSTSGQAKPAVSYQTSTYNPGTANSTSAGASKNAMDTSDVATLNDALGSAGVDLRAEEESLQHSNASASHLSSYPRTYEDRTRKQPLIGSAFDTRFLSATIRTIASNHKVTRVPDDAVAYLALCLRARLQDLVTGMVKTAKYRTDGFDRPAGFYEAVDGAEPTPMWSILVRNDVAKQLAALEKVEREEELRIRKERRERAEMQAAHAAVLAAQGGASNVGDLDGEDTDMAGPGGSKKKRKKEGPGVTARNMSEDVRKKMSNAVATQAAGLGGRYAWMTSATGAGAAKPKPGGTSTNATTSTTTVPATATGSSWARPYVPVKKLGVAGTTTTATASGVGGGAGTGSGQVVFEEAVALTRLTMRDAMFVIDRERGHGGGRGSARGWS